MNWTTMRTWLEQRRDLWIDVLRIYLGIGLFVRGLIFFTSGDQLLFQNFAGGEAYAMLSSGFVMHYVVLAHLCGGTLLAFGLLTRLAAAVQIPVLIGAVVVHSADGVFALGQSLEFAAFVLVTLLFIVAAGPGRLSVDHYTFRRHSVAIDESQAARPATAEQHR
jgi:uncharacterized membrane protein YphA (DoxX/SURF4 family)